MEDIGNVYRFLVGKPESLHHGILSTYKPSVKNICMYKTPK
jgi:hypothetical protein